MISKIIGILCSRIAGNTQKYANANESYWNALFYNACSNAARSTPTGTHEGEILARNSSDVRNSVNSSDVSQEIWNIIKAVSTVELAIAAEIVTAHKRQVI